MPNYKYAHSIDNGCPYGLTFHHLVSIANRDNFTCPSCGEKVDRLFEGTTAFRYDHYSNAEKGMKRDLMEANRLEKEAAYSGKSRDEQAKIKREVDNLTFTK